MDFKEEKERLNEMGPEYYTEKAMTIDKKQITMMINRAIGCCRGPKVLEMSYNDRGWTDTLINRGFELTVIEGSKYNVDYARNKYGDKLTIIHTLFEEYKPHEKYDTIVMSCILEHTLDPNIVLSRAAGWLKEDGVIILVVPNKLSLHRRIGFHLGLIKSMDELSENDLSVGHRRLYTVESLNEEIKRASLYYKQIQGIFLKPLSSIQMMDWPDDLLNAFDKMGNELVEYAGYLFADCYNIKDKK